MGDACRPVPGKRRTRGQRTLHPLPDFRRARGDRQADPVRLDIPRGHAPDGQRHHPHALPRLSAKHKAPARGVRGARGRRGAPRSGPGRPFSCGREAPTRSPAALGRVACVLPGDVRRFHLHGLSVRRSGHSVTCRGHRRGWSSPLRGANCPWSARHLPTAPPSGGACSGARGDRQSARSGRGTSRRPPPDTRTTTAGSRRS